MCGLPPRKGRQFGQNTLELRAFLHQFEGFDIIPKRIILRAMRAYFIAMILFAVSLCSFSQSSHEGIVVTYKGDTLRGAIYVEHGVSSMGNRVIFSGSDKPKKLWAREVEYVECDSGYYYYYTYPMSTATGEIPVLLPRLNNGQLQLFAFAFKAGPGNLITTQHYYFVKSEYSSERITKKNFKRVMSIILEADPELSAKINNGELGFKDMKEIILLYNSRPHILADE